MAKLNCAARGEHRLAPATTEYNVHSPILDTLDEIVYLSIVESFFILNTYLVGIENMRGH